jgi:hypothetical protein
MMKHIQPHLFAWRSCMVRRNLHIARIGAALALGVFAFFVSPIGVRAQAAPSAASTPSPWSSACEAALTADFAARDALPQTATPQAQWNSLTLGFWGPHPVTYPAVTVPAGCDPAFWQQQRILAVIDKIVAMDINYCHHRIPAWTAPPAYQKDIYCSPAKQTEPRWQGLDCSNFTSWVYNYGLGGVRLTGAILPQSGQVGGQQPQWPNDAASGNSSTAGALVKDAGGAYLSVGNGNIDDNLPGLLPGDMLYIMGDFPIGSTNATTVTHVVFWTGRTVSELGVDRIAAPWQPYAQPDDWVIVDSHYAGPAYRPLYGPFEIDTQNATHALGCKSWPGQCVKYSDLVWGVRRLIPISGEANS